MAKAEPLSIDRVTEIASRYILPAPYEKRNPADIIHYLYMIMLADQTVKSDPTDDELEQYIDMYFNL
jgi:hypothetical protein